MATKESNLRAEAAQGGVKDLGVKESGLEPPLIAVFFSSSCVSFFLF